VKIVARQLRGVISSATGGCIKPVMGYVHAQMKRAPAF
jgi:hypothetical protein